MKPVWLIAWNDVTLFLRDRTGYIWLFVMPLAFTVFFGFAMRPDSGPKNASAGLLVENRDSGGLGAALVGELTAQGVAPMTKDPDGKAPRGIRIPEDFTDRILTRERVTIDYFKREGANAEAAFLIELKLFKAIVSLTSDLVTAAVEAPDAGFTERDIEQVRTNRTKRVELKVSHAGRRKVPSGFEQSVPGYMVMFVLMNLLLFGGISISEERAGGVIRRLASYPVTRAEVIFGKLTGRFLLGVVQILFFLLAGRLVFNVDYGEHLGLILLLMAVYGWSCAALGVWIGAVFTSADKVTGICILIALAGASLGGCWWPIELVPDTVRAIGHIFPTAWAMDGLHQLISFGGGWIEIRGELGVLAAFGAVFTVGAAKTLRW